MNFSRAIIFLFALNSHIFFMVYETWSSMAFAAIALLTFVATEIFGAYERMAKFFSSQLEKAAERADANEARIKMLVEAGMRMESKLNEMEAKQTLDGVGRFAGLKR